MSDTESEAFSEPIIGGQLRRRLPIFQNLTSEESHKGKEVSKPLLKLINIQDNKSQATPPRSFEMSSNCCDGYE